MQPLAAPIRRRGLPWTRAGALAVGLALLLLAVTQLLPAHAFVTVVVDDLAQLGAAIAAAALCALATRAVTGSERRLWTWLALASAAWALGQGAWTWFEVVLRVEPPFPSVADLGFLGFTALAAVGLGHWLLEQRSAAYTVRDLLDGGLIAGALLLVSWRTALGTVLEQGDSSLIGYVIAMAYPIGDVVLATAVLLVMARTGTAQRPFVVLLAAGLLALAVADSAYVYLVSLDEYSSGNAISSGWVLGFLLIGAAAVTARDGAGSVPDRRLPGSGLPLLPYLSVSAGLAWIMLATLGGSPPRVAEVRIAGVLVVLLLVRQYLVLRENETLVLTLRTREAALAHEVMHDGLTGLPNRAMLLGRLDQLLAMRERDGRGVVVMYCDLDDFKAINDTMGHHAGDTVLRAVADRLRATMRASDTVARLSGDEFTVLLEPPHDDPLQVAARLITALGAPVAEADGISTGVSVGIAVVHGGAPGRVGTRDLMAAADAAMYSAKSGGGNRAVLVEVDAVHGEHAGGGLRLPAGVDPTEAS